MGTSINEKQSGNIQFTKSPICRINFNLQDIMKHPISSVNNPPSPSYL